MREKTSITSVFSRFRKNHLKDFKEYFIIKISKVERVIPASNELNGGLQAFDDCREG